MQSYAKPLQVDDMDEASKNYRFYDANDFQNSKKINQNPSHCNEIYGSTIASRNNFTETMIFDFLMAGDTDALDQTLDQLVKLKCFSISEAANVKARLLKLYNFIYQFGSDNMDNDVDESLGHIKNMLGFHEKQKRNKQLEYYEELSKMIASLIEASENGDQNSIELLKFMIEHLMELENLHSLTREQSSFLLDKIIKHLQNVHKGNTEPNNHKQLNMDDLNVMEMLHDKIFLKKKVISP